MSIFNRYLNKKTNKIIPRQFIEDNKETIEQEQTALMKTIFNALVPDINQKIVKAVRGQQTAATVDFFLLDKEAERLNYEVFRSYIKERLLERGYKSRVNQAMSLTPGKTRYQITIWWED